MDTIDIKIENWKKKLLDLGKRNRLINFRDTKRSNINILEPSISQLYNDLVNNEKILNFPYPVEKNIDETQNPFTVTDDLEINEQENVDSAENEKYTIIDGDLLTSQTILEQQKTLKALRARAKTSIEEQGINTLYVAFGFLTWKESINSSQILKSPLVLVPVTLTVESLISPFKMSLHEDEIVLNPTLKYKLEQDFNIILPDFNENIENIELYFEKIRDVLSDYNWLVEPTVCLALFSFTKINMYADLNNHAALLKNNPVIKALCGYETDIVSVSDDLIDFDHDKKEKPIEIFQTVDADSSQQDAVLLAKKGVSFVLQGPPGTGKSQTITNIISESLASGKKVLFVSEKMAALDVVYKRLQKVGLADFCLPLHNHKANKKEILQNLEQVFDLEPIKIKEEAYYDLDVLDNERNKLTSYVNQLHTVQEPLGKTIYQVHGELAKLQNIPNVMFNFNGIEKVTSEEFRKMNYLLHTLSQKMGNLNQEYSQNAWKGSIIDTVTHELRKNIEIKFEEVCSNIDTLYKNNTEKFKSINFNNAITYGMLEKIPVLFNLCANAYTIPENWVLQQTNIKLIEDIYTQITDILAVYDSGIFEIDISSFLYNFTVKYTNIFRFFSSTYYAEKKVLKSLQKNSKEKLTDEKIILLLKTIKTIKDTALLQHESIKKDWNYNNQLLKWVLDFSYFAKEFDLTSDFIKKVISLNDIESYQELASVCSSLKTNIKDTINWINELFEHEQQIIDSPLNEVQCKLHKCLNNITGLETWVDFTHIQKECNENGMSEIVTSMYDFNIEPKNIVDSFRKRFYILWLDAMMKDTPEIARFRRKNHEEIIESFKDLDKKQMEIATLRIKENLIKHIPNKNSATSAYDEVGILKRELTKQRRIMPIRKLFAKIPTLLPTLKPCLMMSPLSVSLFLKSELYNFDVVIFDEASQVFTENAIGAIMRSKQIIVAGDNKQLPPTNFFNATTAENDYDTDDEFEDENFESILDEMLAVFPERSLKWHYRSKNEQLITFSNRKIYNSSLVTFPSANEGAKDNGVEYIYVENGVYDRGGKKSNIIEAQHVAKKVFEHFKKSPKRTLGVIAFSEAQQQTIEEEIIKLRLANPLFEPFFNEEKEDAFFIKNIESVQGDERDTIIFSIGYAKDSKGVMYMNFGPLSRQEGYRRLNVAITRAKYNVKLVGSIRPTDIQLEKTNSDGVKMLRSYIEFAIDKNSLENDIQYDTVVNVDSPFEESVYDVLVAKGYKVATQVGCSGYRIDMAIKHPILDGRFVLGIECDGATYHSSRTARERDRLRQTVLEDMGWKIYRIWSTDWIKDPKTESALLIDAVEKAIANYTEIYDVKKTKKKTETDLTKNYSEPATKEIDVNLPVKRYFEPYVEVDVSLCHNNFYRRSILIDTLLNIINIEYPIHYDILCKRIAPLCGNQKATIKVRNEVDWGVTYLKDKLIRITDFFYPKHYKNVIPRMPSDNQEPRQIQYISDAEIGSGMILIISKSFGITKDSLFQIITREFGYNRCTQNMIDKFELALSIIVAEKKVLIIEGKVVVNDIYVKESKNTCIKKEEKYLDEIEELNEVKNTDNSINLVNVDMNDFLSNRDMDIMPLKDFDLEIYGTMINVFRKINYITKEDLYNKIANLLQIQKITNTFRDSFDQSLNRLIIDGELTVKENIVSKI